MPPSLGMRACRKGWSKVRLSILTSFESSEAMSSNSARDGKDHGFVSLRFILTGSGMKSAGYDAIVRGRGWGGLSVTTTM